jgi:hypothetical protein
MASTLAEILDAAVSDTLGWKADKFITEGQETRFRKCIETITKAKEPINQNGSHRTTVRRQENKVSFLQQVYSNFSKEVFYLATQLPSRSLRADVRLNLDELERWVLTQDFDSSLTSTVQKLYAKHAGHEPIELHRTIGDVLSACGIEGSLLDDWGWDHLLRLKNIRLQKPCPTLPHTPWSFEVEPSPELPTLGGLLCEWYHGIRNRTSFPGAMMFKDTQRQNGADPAYLRFIAQMIDGTENRLRVLSLPTQALVEPTLQREWQAWAEMVIRRHHSLPEDTRLNTLAADANITPRYSKTEVHHDSEPHVSIAIGRPGPLKLWIMWPSSESSKLPLCMRNTAAALSKMDHGAFFVQKAGECVIVPPNSPHAVISLADSYLYGHQFRPSAVYEPSSVHVELAHGVTIPTALADYVHAFGPGLQDQKFRECYIKNFLDSWAHAARHFRDSSLCEELVDAWVQDIYRCQDCAWCTHSGIPYDPKAADPHEHICDHMALRRMADSESDSEFGDNDSTRNRRRNHQKGMVTRSGVKQIKYRR